MDIPICSPLLCEDMGLAIVINAGRCLWRSLIEPVRPLNPLKILQIPFFLCRLSDSGSPSRSSSSKFSQAAESYHRGRIKQLISSWNNTDSLGRGANSSFDGSCYGSRATDNSWVAGKKQQQQQLGGDKKLPSAKTSTKDDTRWKTTDRTFFNWSTQNSVDWRFWTKKSLSIDGFWGSKPEKILSGGKNGGIKTSSARRTFSQF